MKKILIIVLLFGMILMTVDPGNPTKASSTNRKEIIFLSRDTTKEENYMVSSKDKLDMMASYLRTNEGVTGEVKFGKPITIRNCEDSFYIPVFEGTKCVAIAIIGVDYYSENGEYCMQISKYFADVINELPNGTYYFEKNSELDSISLIGRNTNIVVNADRCLDYKNQLSGSKTVYLRNNEHGVDILDEIVYNSDDISRSEVTVDLYLGNIIPNGGNQGYCWLCAACEIGRYMGVYDDDLDSAHQVAHGTAHTLNDCNGGNLAAANAVVQHYAGKTGTAAGALLAHDTVISIANYQPVFSGWLRTTTEGHAMVITGYKYNPDNYGFGYLLHDSNQSSQVYLVSSYNATYVGYYIPNSGYYIWIESLYNWVSSN